MVTHSFSVRYSKKQHLSINGTAFLTQRLQINQSPVMITTQLSATSKKRADVNSIAIKKVLKYYTLGIVIQINKN